LGFGQAYCNTGKAEGQWRNAEVGDIGLEPTTSSL
jgi:hypothetical protein